MHNEYICEPRFFLISLFFFVLVIPRSDLLPLPLSTPASHNYPRTISSSLPHSLTFMPFYALLLSLLLSRVDPPPIPSYHIITMSPRAPTSAPCIFLMREIDEEATTASSQRKWSLQTGLEPLTSTSTSQTGSPPRS